MAGRRGAVSDSGGARYPAGSFSVVPMPAGSSYTRPTAGRLATNRDVPKPLTQFLHGQIDAQEAELILTAKEAA